MSVQQPSARGAVGVVEYNAGSPRFKVNRGFRSVERYNIPPGVGVLPGSVLLRFDSQSHQSPDEAVFHATPIPDVLGFQGSSPSAQWLNLTDQIVSGEWCLLVVTTTCDGSADLPFNITVERIN